MGVQISANNTNVPFILGQESYKKDTETIEQDAGRSAVLADKTVMAKKLYTVATTGTADAGNTGDGTVTAVAKIAGSSLLIGDYNLECTEAGADGRVVGAVTAGSNTGNGTVSGFAVDAGKIPKVGTFTLECIGADEGGAATSTSVTITGTGDGVPGAVTPGDDIVEGLYTLTCVEAVTDKGRFEVADPNGNRLEDLNVTVAYSNSHFALTVADGAADYVVGDTLTFTITIAHGGLFKLTDPDGTVIESSIQLPGTPAGSVNTTSGGIDFTITDGSTDFAVDDSFTMVIAVADGGVFKLEDPNGNLIDSGLTMSGVSGGASVFYVGGLTFTITDGSTDFAVADIFLITVTSVQKWVPLDPTAIDGSENFAGVYLGPEITAAALVAGDVVDNTMLVGGVCTVAASQLVFENSAALTTLQINGLTIEQSMAQYGIFAEATTDIDGFEN